MCGIVGVLSRQSTDNQSSQNTNFKKALELLRSRGPDDLGLWQDNYIQLGHTRLSILDLSPLGHQPMSYQNQRFWIAFNGEIYNYLELREELLNLGHKFTSKTDTEVLLASYCQWGESCLEKLRGMFAFGIWDKQRQTLFLGRDRCGEKPLYYWYDANSFYFASELKALIALLPQLPQLDPVAIDLFLHYQYVPEPLTPLTDIFKLPAAHCLSLECQNWQPQLRQYWNLAQVPPVTGDPIELIRQELDRSIELTLRSDVPVGIALSGGIDSGAIAVLAAAKYRDTLQAFSVGYPGRPAYDEREQAEQLAKSLGLPFFDVELSTKELVNFFPYLVAACDDPIADIAAYGHYAVMKQASDRGIKVMLSGLGGDELFWGYPWVAKAAQLTQHKQQFLQSSPLPQWTWKIIWDRLEQITQRRLYHRLTYSQKVPGLFSSILQKLLDISLLTPQYPNQAICQNLKFDFIKDINYLSQLYTSDLARQIPPRNPYRIFELLPSASSDIPVQICQLLFGTWLVSNCLALGDRVSMASSVETRIPFLDYKLVELVIGLRKAQPDLNFGQKYWLKSALKEILPDEVLNRKKQGFQPPVQEWMRAIIHEYRDWLKSGYLVELKIISGEVLAKMLKNVELASQNLFVLYKLILLEIWYRKVVLQET